MRIILLSILFSISVFSSELRISMAEARIFSVGQMTGEGGWNLWSMGHVGEWFEMKESGVVEVTIRMSGLEVGGVFPLAEFAIGGSVKSAKAVKRLYLTSEKMKDYHLKIKMEKGVNCLLVRFMNDGLIDGKDRNLVIESLSLRSPQLQEKLPIDPVIKSLRMVKVKLFAKPGTILEIEQKKHEFCFGTAVSNYAFFDAPKDKQEKYRKVLLENFNWIVPENCLKWRQIEVAEGRILWQKIDTLCAWAADNNLTIRGHCIFWAVDQFVPEWLKKKSKKELRKCVQKRAYEVCRRFKKQVVEYDVNNEMLHGHFFSNLLGQSIRVDMFRYCQAANSAPRLFVNDYQILSDNMLPNYLKQIRELLAAGAPISGIGLQGHFGFSEGNTQVAGIDPLQLQEKFDALAKFKLPIKITEFDVDTKNEQAKANALRNMFRVAFAHSSVDGIMLWGFWEDAHWKKNAALWRSDWTMTPAAKMYRKLVYEQWWSHHKITVGKSGVASIELFKGDYLIKKSDGKSKAVTINKKNQTISSD